MIIIPKTLTNKFLTAILTSIWVFTACANNLDAGIENWPGEGIPQKTGNKDSGIPQVDNPARNFMSKYNIPGLSVAFTKDGKLVYRKGYGDAIKGKTPATDSSLFRIASLSKIFTSVAIMKLREEGKLNLSDKVFGKGAILGTKYETQPYGKYITEITVNNLLHHTEGGWQNDSDDPMFHHPNLDKEQLISWVLDNRPLAHAPGTHYAYSNFGYCILGRVIEKLTGMPYAKYVQDSILKPIGITDMQIAGNKRSDVKPNEVVYYQPGGADPYGMNVCRMDSHGGWIATASDIVRFLVHVDGFPNPLDILNSKSISLLTTPSSANHSYACGILVNNVHNWWHTGALPGTASEFVRSHNGYIWTILMNTRSNNSNDFWKDLDNLGWIPVNDPATQWPDTNLFKNR